MQDVREKVNEVLSSARSVVFGQEKMIDSIFAALVCDGHLLIEGMPGLGKTLSVSVMSKLCDLSFKRVQFTPDLLPSDLIGTMIYNQDTQEFITKFGPIFTQILLADEINRSPAKVQSALLEAMAEKQVTIGDESHRLTNPFVVLATQNPIDQEGTYQLPEAQMDRFMMKISIDYPSYDAEKNILDLKENPTDTLTTMLTLDELIEIQNTVKNIYVDEKIKELIVKIVQSTRPEDEKYLAKYQGAIIAGASPRACIWLHKISKYIALMQGRDFVTPEDILRIVPDVLGHRIILSYEATIDKLNTRQIAIDIAESLI